MSRLEVHSFVNWLRAFGTVGPTAWGTSCGGKMAPRAGGEVCSETVDRRESVVLSLSSPPPSPPSTASDPQNTLGAGLSFA